MQKIKNIIFDYGNVIFEIDFKRAQNALLQCGILNVEEFFAHKKHNTLFNDFETGAISNAEFRQGIRLAARNEALTDAEIDAAWNSLLVGVPENIHDVLLGVKEKYRTFLLSNNNAIHFEWIMKYLKETHQLESNDGFFERTYYSHQMRLRKPDVTIFNQVINENNLIPDETLFIDDSPQHIEGAKAAGLRTLLITEHPSQLGEILKRMNLI